MTGFRGGAWLSTYIEREALKLPCAWIAPSQGPPDILDSQLPAYFCLSSRMLKLPRENPFFMSWKLREKGPFRMKTFLKSSYFCNGILSSARPEKSADGLILFFLK